MSGVQSNITFNVKVIANDQGILVSPQDPAGISIDVRNTLGLTAQIADLLTLVPGVDMLNEVKFQFELQMEPGCQ